MAKKVTLYIDDSSLRLLVTQGLRIKEWANVPLEPGLVKNNVIKKEDEVSSRIRSLFKVQKVKGKTIQVGISGLHCLSRPLVLPGLPKEMLGEVVIREAKRLLPVPVENLYLTWEVLPSDAGKTTVFLIAVPRDTVDSLIKTLRGAGLQANFLGIKPLLLTRLTKGASGIIVDVQANEFDVAVVSGGVCQPVRTVSFANEGLTWREKLPIIVSDTERTIAFYNTNNPERVLANDVPIFASGELINEDDLCQTLSKKTGHPVVPLSTPLEHSSNFVAGVYIANIAMALDNGGGTGFSAFSLNALPAIYQPKTVSLTRILALPAAVVIAGLLVAVFLFIQSGSAGSAALKNDLLLAEKTLQQKMSQKQGLSNNVTSLEKQLNEIKVNISKLTAAIGTLETKTKGLDSDLKTATGVLPQTMTLKTITHAGNLLTVTGRAPNEKELLSYVDKLSASGVFADVSVTGISRAGNSTAFDFTLLGNHEGQKIAASSLEVAINNLPPDVKLLQISYGKGAMSISASTPVQDSMLTYVSRLEKSGRFSDIIVNNMANADPGQTNFSLSLKTGE